MEANILGKHRYFKMCAYILIGSKYFDMRRYFEMCAYILILSAKIFDLYINFDFESRLIYTIKDKNPTTFYIKT